MSTLEPWLVRIRTAVVAVTALLIAIAPEPAIGQSSPASETLVIFVRHAEAGDDDPRDPTLSEAGVERAASLAAALVSARPAAIYATQYRRTQQTAAPLAEALGIDVSIHPVRSPDIDEFARGMIEMLRRDHHGETVLVVGHSNTIPALVRAGAGVEEDDIPHDIHDRMYVIRLADGEPVLIRARY